MKYSEQDYNGALRIYREEFAKVPNDAVLNYRMGECHFALKEYDLALEKFNAAEKANNAVDADLYLLLGKTNQALANLDKALEQYEKYRTTELKVAQMQEINIRAAPIAFRPHAEAVCFLLLLPCTLTLISIIINQNNKTP